MNPGSVKTETVYPIRRIARFGVGLMTSLLMIWLFLEFLRRSNVGHIVHRIEGTEIAASLLIVTGLFLARAIRFSYLISIRGAPYGAAVGVTMQAYALNNVLPFRLGELWRVERLRRLRRAGIWDAAGLSVFERSFDVVSCLVLMLPAGVGYAALLFAANTEGWLHFLQICALALTLLLIVVLVLSKHPRIVGARKTFWRMLRSMRELLSFMAIGSAIVWAFEYAVYQSVGWAVGIDVPVSILFLIIGFSNLFSSVIPSPGGIGAFEASVVWLLTTIAGYGLEQAATYAIIVHAVLIVPVTVVGFAWLLIDLIRRRISPASGA